MSTKEKHITLYLALGFIALVILMSLAFDLFVHWFGWNTTLNLDAINQPPFQSPISFLGTNDLGQNILFLVISGAKYSLGISFFSALFAGTIGIFIGGIAGYFGDNSMKIKRYHMISFLVSVLIFWFYTNLGLTMNTLNQSLIAYFLASMLSLGVWKLLCASLKKIKSFNYSIYLPIDILNTKFTEIVFAIPSYFIILAFSSFLGNSMWAIILVLALTSWPQSALLMRAELLRIREMNYINALKLSGIDHIKILIKHAIPNAISPLLVNFVFFVSGLLIVESTLSYIGIGLSADITTWGKVISSFKHNTANWWVAFFPGIIIFLTILSIHKIGNWLEEKLL